MQGKANQFFGVVLSMVLGFVAIGCGSSHHGGGGGGTPPSGPTISSTFLPMGTPNTAYSATLAATGGTGTYTFSIAQGGLPVGLTLSPSGTITGTPTTVSTTQIVFKVQDTGGQSSQTQLTLTVDSSPSVTTTTLPAGTVGTAYSATLQATGGIAPYAWAVNSGTLPAGVGLNSANGTLTGTPTATGSFSVRFNVTDGASNSATSTLLTITVN